MAEAAACPRPWTRLPRARSATLRSVIDALSPELPMLLAPDFEARGACRITALALDTSPGGLRELLRLIFVLEWTCFSVGSGGNRAAW